MMRLPTRRTSFALLILVAITALIVGSAGRLFSFAISGDTNLDLIADVMNPCVSTPIASSSKMAIIRLDDVQAYAWADVSLKMIDDADARGIPLVLGVIPKGIEDDLRTYGALRDMRCTHEIAQHGWDHGNYLESEAPEFRGMSYDDALVDIEKGKNALEKLARERMTTFIPPNNELSVETVQAIETLKIPVISSEGPNRYDFGSATFDYDTDSLTSVERIVSECNARTASTSLCVVMMHPQDFAPNQEIDEEKYALYLNTLDALAAEGYTFVRFKDLVEFDRSLRTWKDYLSPTFSAR